MRQGQRSERTDGLANTSTNFASTVFLHRNIHMSARQLFIVAGATKCTATIASLNSFSDYRTREVSMKGLMSVIHSQISKRHLISFFLLCEENF